MKYFICLFIVLAFFSCTEITPDSSDEIIAEKDSWIQMTKSSDDRAFAKDIPWQEGDKVMLIRVDAEEKIDKWGIIDIEDATYMCTVSKAAGLKCTLNPEKHIESGIYHAVYPVYDYVTLFASHGLVLHLSFLYEDGLGLDYKHQDIVISDPVTYKEGHKLSFVMKHVCALVDIDIYPPKTGNFTLLKVVADEIAFAGKANYIINEAYDINKMADGWFNFTTLRGEGTYMKEGEPYQTSTGLLPVQYDGMPMRVYIVYDDGTSYLSEPFSMPSLKFGVLNSLTVDKFNEIEEPVQGFWGDYYMDDNPQPYDIIY